MFDFLFAANKVHGSFAPKVDLQLHLCGKYSKEEIHYGYLCHTSDPSGQEMGRFGTDAQQFDVVMDEAMWNIGGLES